MGTAEPLTPVLVTLATALARFSVPIRTGRRLIRQGRLPAAKIGREYFVDPSDVAQLFKPTLATTSATKRETPSEREARQLAAAGIRISNA